jgi:hypothetical protein
MAERYFNKIQMWNEIAREELDENTNKSTKFWLIVWQDWALAREYDVIVDIEKYPISSTRGGSSNFQTSLVLLIPNCIRHRMITYTNSDEMSLKPREV